MIKLQTLLTISIVKEAETHHLMIRYDCNIFLNLPRCRIAILDSKTPLIKRRSAMSKLLIRKRTVISIRVNEGRLRK